MFIAVLVILSVKRSKDHNASLMWWKTNMDLIWFIYGCTLNVWWNVWVIFGIISHGIQSVYASKFNEGIGN